MGIRLLSSDAEPLPEAVVEIWHCDALGRYSGFAPPDPALMVTAESALKVEVVPGDIFLGGGEGALLEIRPAEARYRAAVCFVVPVSDRTDG